MAAAGLVVLAALPVIGIHVDNCLQRTWSDSEHDAIVLYEGTVRSDGVGLEHVLASDGRTVRLRPRYQSIKPDAFVPESERSSDDGSTW